MAINRITMNMGPSPYVSFYLDADHVETVLPGDRGYANGAWRIRYYLRMSKGSSSSFGGAGVQTGRGSGVEFGRVERNPFLPSGLTGWNEGPWYVFVPANASGYFAGSSTNYPLEMHLVYGSVAQIGYGSIPLPRIAQVPGKPAAPVLRGAPGVTTIPFNITAPNNGGAAISTYRFQVSRNAAFTDIVRTWTSGASQQTANTLPPGTELWIRYAAINARGQGPYSDALRATTLPSVAPTLAVTPSLLGTSASVAITPPQGVTTVDLYRIERQPPNGSPVVTYDTATSPLVASDLAPGETNLWRVSAFIGEYQTPWSEWLTVTQPQPNTNPGDYFDGSTPARPDTTYAWDGSAGASTSRALARVPAGWRTFAEGADASGGAGVVMQSTGGRSGAHAARVIFFADAEGAGFRAGTAVNGDGLVEVAEGGVYWGSIYVGPPRAQRMAAELLWFGPDGSPLGSSLGEARTVAPSAMPERQLVVQGQAPAGATGAAVGWTDVEGDDWAPWLGGEVVVMDDAMASIGELYPWFSGDTPDTADFAFSWADEPNASISIATALDPELSDPLADPDCAPIPAPPVAPTIVDECLEETGSWRRYWAVIDGSQVSEWLDLIPTIAITTGALPARQVRVRVWRNPDELDPGEYPIGAWDAEQIISYIPARTTLTIDGVARRVWAAVDGAPDRAADRLLYGTGGGPASWPVLSCGTGYLLSFDVPLDAPEGNIGVDVALTTRML